MGQRACDKCGELVDEAKAFCPGCGHAFVEEEQRQEQSKFDKMDSTIQMGNTMYGQMLSDMGLNISKTPEAVKSEIRTEMVAPIATGASRAKQAPAEAAGKKSYLVWVVVGVFGLIFLLALLVVVVAVVILYLNR